MDLIVSDSFKRYLLEKVVSKLDYNSHPVVSKRQSPYFFFFTGAGCT